MIASYLGDTGVYVVLLPWFHWYLDPHLGRLYMWLLFVGGFKVYPIWRVFTVT